MKTRIKPEKKSTDISHQTLKAGIDLQPRAFETSEPDTLQSGPASNSFKFGEVPIARSELLDIQRKPSSLPHLSVADSSATKTQVIQRRPNITGDDLTLSKWKSFSSLGLLYKRSTALKEIDQAVSSFEQQADIVLTDDTYSDKMDALNQIDGAIISWKRTKKTNPNEAESSAVSKRLAYVDQLAAIVAEKKKQLSVAAFPDEYSQLAVFSEGSMTDDSGKFVGESAKAYEDYRKQIEKKRSKARTQTALDARIRVAMLTERVKEAHKEMQEKRKAKGDEGTQVVGLFTAQEWYFKHPGTPFDQTDKQTIVQAFQALSAQCRDMVIVPGSIVWSQGAEDSLELRNTAVAFMNGKKLHETNKRSEGFDIDGYKQVDPKTGRSVAASKEEWAANWRRGGGIMSGDGGTDNVATDAALFNVGPLSFSLEICADHGSARALKDMQERQIQPANGAHVQILVSHGATLMNGSSAMRPDGVGVATDGIKYSDRLGGVRKVYQGGPISDGSLKKEANKTVDLSKLFMGIYDLPE